MKKDAVFAEKLSGVRTALLRIAAVIASVPAAMVFDVTDDGTHCKRPLT